MRMDNLNKKSEQPDKASDTVEEDDRDHEVADCSSVCTSLPVLNSLRSPRWFLVFLSIAACTQGLLINGLVNVVITTIELRFGLKSADTGLIAASNDVGSLLVMLPASHLGGRLGASKPRWIAGGLLLVGLGSLVWTVPHFATEPYSAGEEVVREDQRLCGDKVVDECSVGEHEDQGLRDYKNIFILGQVLIGVGMCPLISLGTTFMEESVSNESSPIYISIFQVWFVIGPALGYVLGGHMLSLHTDLTRHSSLTPASSLWVGAWWPGFFLTGVVAILTGICIHLYPPSINRKRDTAVKVMDSGEREKGFLGSLFSLLSNPTYLLLAMASGGDGAIISGYAAFLPKFMEQQYGLTTGLAAQVVGLVVVPAGGMGTVLGGWILKRLSLRRNGVLLMAIAVQVATLLMVGSFLLTCPGAAFASEDACPCSCPGSYDPVCGSDSLMHLSPCHAGCSTSLPNNTFTHCSCVEGGLATRTTCSTECGFFAPFVAIIFVVVLTTFLLSLPLLMACMWSVQPRERSLAIGLQSCLWKLLGAIPGPIVFGRFLDSTCLVWDQGCGELLVVAV